MQPDIDLSGLDLSGPLNAYQWQPAARRRVTKGRHTAIDATAEAVELIKRLPGPNETCHMLMNGTFAMIDLAPAIIALAGKPIDDLTVFTLGWNANTTGTLAALMREKRVQAASVIASHYFVGADRAEYQRGHAELTKAGVRVTYARSHVKALFAVIGKRTFTAHGSANFRSCSNLENVCLTGSPSVFRMFGRLAKDIFQNPSAYRQ